MNSANDAEQRLHAEATSQTLLELVRSQDEDAWRCLTELYGPLVYHWCRKAGVGAEDAMIIDVHSHTWQYPDHFSDDFRDQAQRVRAGVEVDLTVRYAEYAATGARAEASVHHVQPV